MLRDKFRVFCISYHATEYSPAKPREDLSDIPQIVDKSENSFAIVAQLILFFITILCHFVLQLS